MTVSDTQAGTWAPVRGAGYYEACTVGGRVRSVKRTINGRKYEGVELTPKRTGTSRYWQVKLTFDDGKQRTVPVGVLVLLAHVGEPKPGQQCCHADDNPDNNDLSNLSWEYDPVNREDRWRNSPPQPKAPKACIRCGDEFAGNGRRCHPCVVDIGVEARRELAAGKRLKAVTERVGYPVTVDGLDGVLALAVKYGGYGQSRSRRVRQRLAARLAGGDAR